MDEKLKERTNKYIRTASLRIENEESKCLLEIIKIQAQRITDLEEHMEWVFRKLGDHDKFIEFTQRTAGFSDLPNGKPEDLQSIATESVNGWRLGFSRMGITVSDPAHQGLQFTAMDDHDERSDPDSTTIEQPIFRRRMFDNT